MVQIIPAAQRTPKFSQRLGSAIQQGLEGFSEIQKESKSKKAMEALGIDPNLSPELQKVALTEKLKGQASIDKLNRQAEMYKDILKEEEPANENFIEEEPSTAKPSSKKTKNKIPYSQKQIEAAIATDPTRARLMQQTNENAQRHEEAENKAKAVKESSTLNETKDFRLNIANKAQAAQHGIQNKQRMLDIIRKGDVNDPTYAIVAQALPFHLGERLLSNDTVTYKAALVDEFTDLRNIFQGQTRIKEIDLLEQKIADLYLDDEQKEAIIKSRINALQSDVIIAEVAAELEKEDPRTILDFQRELQNRAKPKLDALFNRILDEQKFIVDQAEKRKQSDFPLDPNNPEDKNILMQIMQEAGGDKAKARQIAKKKGYKF